MTPPFQDMFIHVYYLISRSARTREVGIRLKCFLVYHTIGRFVECETWIHSVQFHIVPFLFTVVIEDVTSGCDKELILQSPGRSLRYVT